MSPHANTPDSASASRASHATAPTPWFSFATPEFRADPFPFYARLRREMPIVRLTHGRRGTSFYVARYDDVLALLKDTDRFANDRRSAGQTQSWLSRRLSMGVLDSMIGRDGDDHRRLRTLAHQAFTPARIALLEGRISQLCTELLDAADARSRFDLVADFALPLPIAVISYMMGVDSSHRRHFHHWMRGIIDLDGAGLLELLTNVPNLIQLNRFLRTLISERRAQKGDDVLSALVAAEEAGDRLSFDELVASTLLILLAGHETTVNLIGNGMLALLQHPDQLARLRAAPELIDSAVEEMLRFTSPVQLNAPRFARRDTEICGVHIPRGASLCPLLGSANRDESHFADPDRFDIGRKHNRHLALGYGPHFCLGAPLARLEAKIAFRALLGRYSDLQLAVSAADLVWRRSHSVRGLTSLPLRVRRVGASGSDIAAPLPPAPASPPTS